ncbi:unnamed protein product [Durusdinium trenchii]|uniref:Uncharacterized protein n=1 Tax=Durusdinium trenchii TaxID=1381693 RepID=A0ABP0QRG0_9DINO
MALFSPASPGWRAHHAPSDTRPCDRAGSAPRARRGVRRPCRTAQVGLGLSALAVAHRRGARGRVRVPTRQWSVARRAEEVDLDLPELELEPGVLSEAPEMTFMIEEIPSRSSSSLIIHHRLGSESQVPAILKLVEEYLPKFDVYNCATALHKCGLQARDNELAARQIQSDPNFIRLFAAAKKKTLRRVADLEATTLATILWSCARLNIVDSELTSAITTDATTRMNHYSTNSIGILMFSLGFSGVRPRPSLQKALLTELQGRQDFDTESLLLIVYACMRLGIRDRRIMEVAGQHIVQTGLEDCEPLTVACFCYAYGKLEYFERQVLATLGQRTLKLVDDFSPRMLNMALLGLAAATGQMEELDPVLEKLKVVVEDRMAELSYRDVSTCAFAFGKYSLLSREREEALEAPGSVNREKWARGIVTDQKDEAFVKALKDEVLRRDHESFTMAELNLIVYALMRMKHRDQDFLGVCARLFEENSAELMLVEILNILYAFGRVDYIQMGLVQRLIEELERRNEWETWEPLHWATLSYSLAVNQVRHERLMDRIAIHFCEHIREFDERSISMLAWGLAFLNCRNHGEAVASVLAEELSRRSHEFSSLSLTVSFWAVALLGGKSAALQTMNVMFKEGFWSRDFGVSGYSQLYMCMACWQAELGIQVDQLVGYEVCRKCYEETTILYMGEQHRRLSDRLRVQQIPHQANSMAPTLDNFNDAGVRADIIIEKLKLVIEVEGPQRSTIPMELLAEKLKEEEPEDGAGESRRESRRTVLAGERAEVLVQAREYVECGLSGSAAWKRRLLRSCGWRVVTVSFDESEEYIADALKKMIKTDSTEEARSDEEASQGFGASSMEDLGEAPTELDPMSIEKPREDEMSDYEIQLREAHQQAMRKLKLRLLQEREDLASSKNYGKYMQYREWQVEVEKEIMQELVESLQVPASTL